MCAPMSTAALFTIVERWRQPKFLSMGEQINVVYPFNEILFGLKKEIMMQHE